MLLSIFVNMSLPDEASNLDKSVASTLTGRVDVARPTAAQVRVLDMAWALSMLCRYNGQVPFFYSVAEHSVLATHLSEAMQPDLRGEVRLAVLCHDLHEAYMGDFISPLKVLFPEYRELERRWEEAVREALGLRLSVEESDHVVKVDRLMKVVETSVFFDALPSGNGELSLFVAELVAKHGPRGWNPGTAHEEFTTVLKSLWQGVA